MAICGDLSPIERNSMQRRATTAILMSATGTVLAGSLAMTAAAIDGGAEVGKAAYDSVTAVTGHQQPPKHHSKARAKHRSKHRAKPKKRIVAGTSRETTRKRAKKKGLPSGLSTATSFWD